MDFSLEQAVGAVGGAIVGGLYGLMRISDEAKNDKMSKQILKLLTYPSVGGFIGGAGGYLVGTILGNWGSGNGPSPSFSDMTVYATGGAGAFVGGLVGLLIGNAVSSRQGSHNGCLIVVGSVLLCGLIGFAAGMAFPYIIGMVDAKDNPSGAEIAWDTSLNYAMDRLSTAPILRKVMPYLQTEGYASSFRDYVKSIYSIQA